MSEQRLCPQCGELSVSDGNFCGECGAKISPICPACWREEGQPNSCPGEKCPDQVVDQTYLIKYKAQIKKGLIKMTNKEKLDSIIGKLFDQVNDSANKKEAINADTLTALEILTRLTSLNL